MPLKISSMTLAGTIDGTEVIPILQNGANRRIPWSSLRQSPTFDATYRALHSGINQTHDLYAAVLAVTEYYNPSGTIAIATGKQVDVIRGDFTVDCDDAGTGRFGFFNYNITNNTGNAPNSNVYGFVGQITATGNSTSKSLYANAVGGVGHTGTLVGGVFGVRPAATSGTSWAIQVGHGDGASAGIYIDGDVLGDNLGNGIVFGSLSDYQNAVIQWNQPAVAPTAPFLRVFNGASTVIFRVLASGAIENNVAGTAIDLLGSQSSIQQTNTTRAWSLQAVTAGDYYRILAGGVGDVFTVNSSGRVGALSEFAVNGTKVVGAREAGWTAATGTANKGAFATGTATTTQCAERIKAIEDALRTHGLIN